MTPRTRALARLLEDWEGGRMTAIGDLSCHLTSIGEFYSFADTGWIALLAANPPKPDAQICLTPAGFMAAQEARAGLSAARRVGEKE